MWTNFNNLVEVIDLVIINADKIKPKPLQTKDIDTCSMKWMLSDVVIISKDHAFYHSQWPLSILALSISGIN